MYLWRYIIKNSNMLNQNEIFQTPIIILLIVTVVPILIYTVILINKKRILKRMKKDNLKAAGIKNLEHKIGISSRENHNKRESFEKYEIAKHANSQSS